MCVNFPIPLISNEQRGITLDMPQSGGLEDRDGSRLTSDSSASLEEAERAKSQGE